ncbi:MAG: TRAP transporter substrate-binding protein [Pseudomonadota bacterium]
MTNTILRLGAAALLGVALAGTASAETIRLAYETSDTHLKARTAAVFAEELTKLTNGEVTVETFPKSSLIPSRQEVNAAIRGQTEAIVPFISYYESVAPSVKVFTMPMLFSDYDHLAKVWAGPIGNTIAEELNAVGLKPLAFWYETPTHLFTTGTEVTNLGELDGLKIRTYPSALLESTLTNLGAVATVIPGSELYVALQNNTVDGAITTPSFAQSLKLTEVLSTMTVVDLAFGGYIFAINDRFFSGLSEEHQDAVLQAAEAATAWNQKEIATEVDKTLEAMKSAGVTVLALDDGDRDAWIEAVGPVYAEQGPELQALIELAQ